MAQSQVQGTPCWYELTTSDLAGGEKFYGAVFGWKAIDAGMTDFAYHLAQVPEGGMAAGMMELTNAAGDPPPSWLVYFGCDDCDQSVTDIVAAGGKVIREAADIPGTGRFAICADPQGAVVGLLQPLPMDQPLQYPAFNPSLPGYGAWNELMTTDPVAAQGFYGQLFGWAESSVVDMGDMGTYHIFRHDGTEVGGMMGLGNSPVPVWLPYFGVADVAATVADIAAAGGAVHHGPADVPGGRHIAVATDPQGAWFAVVSTLVDV